VEKSGKRQLTDVEASLRSAIQSQNAVTCIFGQNELLHNLRSRGLPASPDIVRRLYDGYGFAAVRKPTHSNFQISAKKQAKTQYLCSFWDAKTKSKRSKLLTAFWHGIVATVADLWKLCTAIGDTVFRRCKIIFLNSKNNKPKHSKQYSVMFCAVGLLIVWLCFISDILLINSVV